MISIPFSGSKRYSYKHVKPIVSLGRYDTVYEPFGGSGVLSVNLYNDGIVSHAVVNDYDHFFDEYETYLDLKDLVVKKCRLHGLEPQDGLLEWNKRFVLQSIILDIVDPKYWKYFYLGGNFVFSKLTNQQSWHHGLYDFCCYRGNLSTDKQREYLKVYQQLQVEHLDYKDFLDKFSYNRRSILLVDPPYYNTRTEQYAGQFGEGDTEELVEHLRDTHCDFIFFNHEMEQVRHWLNGFDAEYFVTGRKNRPDIMAYVKQR